MRLLFVEYAFSHQGSAQDISGYVKAARALGHEVVLHGPPAATRAFPCSLDVESVDAVVFILEWGIFLHYGGPLHLVRLLHHVPRRRRVVIDCDGNYNAAMRVTGDLNHADAAASEHRIRVYDSLTDKIYQPTLHPRRPNVGTFLFHGYDPDWAVPLDGGEKEFGMVYVGNVWFRWHPMSRLLKAVEPIRERVGRIAVVGAGWDRRAWWAARDIPRESYYSRPAYLRRLGVECHPPCPFYEAIPWMSRAVWSPVIYRPLFDHLQLVTCRTFETPAAGAIPVFDQPGAFVAEIYGRAARELALGRKTADATAKLLDVLERPAHYGRVVRDIRCHLEAHHSYTARVQELLRIVQQ